MRHLYKDHINQTEQILHHLRELDEILFFDIDNITWMFDIDDEMPEDMCNAIYNQIENETLSS